MRRALSVVSKSADSSRACAKCLLLEQRRAIVADGVECHVMSKNRYEVVGRV